MPRKQNTSNQALVNAVRGQLGASGPNVPQAAAATPGGIVPNPVTGGRPRASAAIMGAFNIGQSTGQNTGQNDGSNPVNDARAREKKRREAMSTLSGGFATRSETF